MRPCRISITVFALTLLTTAALAAEPLEELREALSQPVLDPKNDDEVAFRKTTLEKRAKALAVADLPGALRLIDWKDEDKEEAVALVDRNVRRGLIERCKNEFGQVLAKGNTDGKLAAITAIGEMGIELRGGEGKVHVAREFTAELLKSLHSDSGAVRQAAARALAKTYPDGKLAAPALGMVLQSKDVNDRRAAAQGLAGILQILSQLTAGRANTSFVELIPATAFEETILCLAACKRGLTDDDPSVRRYSQETVLRAAELLGQSVPEGEQQQQLARPGRKLTPQEEALLKEARKAMEIQWTFLMRLENPLNGCVQDLRQSLASSDVEVVISACAALESLAETRQRLQQWWERVARVVDAKPFAAPFSELGPTVPKLADLLKHKEVKVRLAALYVLETLETLASPAASALFEAVGDPDPFVRWGIARALGKLAPRQPEVAVPGLAKLIDDPNGDVRITALAGLERFGKAARTAVPRLDPAVNRGDVETRYWVIQALAAVGKDASPAVPALATALADKEVKLRLAAARAIRKIGPTDAAVPALRKALDDPDAEVRRAASEALLAR